MEEKNNEETNKFEKLLEKDDIQIPHLGDIIKGIVVTASKAEVKLDVNGILMGIIRGPELYNEVEEFSNLKPGDEVEAAVIDTDNEEGELELSFRLVGQEKAWDELHQALKDKSTIKVKITDANKGGLLSRYCQIDGFLPVSQLAPENYPRISGGDKSKILEKLKSFVGQEFEVAVITLNEEDNKIIFSEKDVWNKKQKPALDKYKTGMEVEGHITAITNFGVFVSFGENIEGLIHISELAWQRIDSPSEMYKVGDPIKAVIITIDGAKVFLSAKKLLKDPWMEASAKYSVGQIIDGEVLKINPFGLFIKLDNEIHGLAHISQLNLGLKDKIIDLFKVGEVKRFEIVSISPSEHRLGLKLVVAKSKTLKTTKVGAESKISKTSKTLDLDKTKKTIKASVDDKKIKDPVASTSKDKLVDLKTSAITSKDTKSKIAKKTVKTKKLKATK